MPITMVSRRRRGAAPDRGAALVEAAFVIPILFGLVFGIMEIGGALRSYSSAANAVRAGGPHGECGRQRRHGGPAHP